MERYLLFCYNYIVEYGGNKKAIDIIEKKQKNEILEYDEIKYMVNSYVKGKINDKTMSDFLWQIYNNGLTSI